MYLGGVAQTSGRHLDLQGADRLGERLHQRDGAQSMSGTGGGC
jgi:hypothetical protein